MCHGIPISPVLANMYMEHFEATALTSFEGNHPSHWYRYVDDTWVKYTVAHKGWIFFFIDAFLS